MDLGDGLRLRLIRPGDGVELAKAYSRNRAHLEPWDPVRAPAFTAEHQEAQVGLSLREAAEGRSARFLLFDDGGRVLGRVNLNNIVRGAFHSADLGYWIDASLAGRGIMRRAVSHVRAHAQEHLGLHRIQAATLVHNVGSQRVLEVNGFRRIGLAPRYLRIAGEWQDHLLFQRLLEASR